jgi:hypothetical protein
MGENCLDYKPLFSILEGLYIEGQKTHYFIDSIESFNKECAAVEALLVFSLPKLSSILVIYRRAIPRRTLYNNLPTKTPRHLDKRDRFLDKAQYRL